MSSLAEAVTARKVRRLCHFTPSRNLAHILADGEGVLATRRLEEDERKIVNATDLKRIDGHVGHICCSVEYPNAHYFRKARVGEVLFKDWVVVMIDPSVILLPGVRFCPCNASTGGGKKIQDGLAGFNAMYAQRVVGGGGRSFDRTKTRPVAAPTDMQAEVLIPDRVPIERITAIAVMNEAQAILEIARLRRLSVTPPPFVVAPIFYDPEALRDALSIGKVPPEQPFVENF
jgi:hypothetical protein